MDKKVNGLFKDLLSVYGPQGWWPLVDYRGSNPTKTGSVQGYHPGDYGLPKTTNQVYEICLGSLLTQSVGWPSVEKALTNLKKLNAINPKTLLSMDEDALKKAIKQVGYFNQKARKVKEFTRFFVGLNGRTPTRDELLSVWGVGKETADSILLYAFKVPTFVVDAYTRRIFSHIGLINEKDEYDKIKAIFERNIPPDLNTYQEYHALIVEHAKRHCKTKPVCDDCPLKRRCGAKASQQNTRKIRIE